MLGRTILIIYFVYYDSHPLHYGAFHCMSESIVSESEAWLIVFV